MRSSTNILSAQISLWLLLTMAGCGGSSSSSQIIQVDGYRFNFSGERATRTERGIIPPEVTVVVVENRFGAVEIAAGDEQPKWEWEVSCWAENEMVAKQYTSEVKAVVEFKNDQLTWKLVVPKPPVEALRGVVSNVALLVPASVRVELNNAHGESKIHGVAGGTKARCSHGSLGLLDLGGHLDAEMAHGDLNGNQLPECVLANSHGDTAIDGVDGTLKLKGAHGDVTLSHVTGAVEVDNDFGRVTVLDVDQNLRIRNDHGAIRAERVGGALDLVTSFATMEVLESSGHLRLRNHHGDVIIQGGSHVDAAAKFGAIRIESSAANIQCRNEHGSIEIKPSGSTFHHVDAETTFGVLQVRLPSGIKPVIQAGAEFGKLKSAFPVLQLNTDVDNFADLDANTPRMTLKNSHGDILIKNTK